jgi:hypothetical protein
MASGSVNTLMEGAGSRRPSLRVGFQRIAAKPSQPEWWHEPEYEGVYALAEVNGRRPPFFWHRGPEGGPGEWLISGRCYLRADRGWVIRLSSGHLLGRADESHITLAQGSWAPASGGRLAVRASDGAASAWLADGRTIEMRGVFMSPGAEDDVVEATLRFRRLR